MNVRWQNAWWLLATCLTCSAPPPAASSATTPAGTTPSRAADALARYLPLPHDSVLTFGGWLPSSREREKLILQVSHPTPDRATLRSGNQVQRVVYAADGVRLLAGGYLLRAPLALQARFRGPVGEVVVTAVDQLVTVPAGRFAGCVETTETGGSPSSSRRIVTTYCPDVGVVKFTAESDEGERRFELESFGPRVDVNDL